MKHPGRNLTYPANFPSPDANWVWGAECTTVPAHSPAKACRPSEHLAWHIVGVDTKAQKKAGVVKVLGRPDTQFDAADSPNLGSGLAVERAKAGDDGSCFSS